MFSDEGEGGAATPSATAAIADAAALVEYGDAYGGEWAERGGEAALLGAGTGDMGGLTGGEEAAGAARQVGWRDQVEEGVAAEGTLRPNPVKPKNPPPVPMGLTSFTGVVGVL